MEVFIKLQGLLLISHISEYRLTKTKFLCFSIAFGGLRLFQGYQKLQNQRKIVTMDYNTILMAIKRN